MRKITAADPLSKSADLVADNLAQMSQLFPEAFTEHKVDFDVLRQLLGDTVDDREEKFGLNWRGKRQARQLALTPSTGTLLPCPDESVDWDTTKNIFIEGDNLEVLKLLQKSYAGKVKLIYIDPPYNTGNDFIYEDDYRDGLANYLRLSGQVGADEQRLSSNSEASGRFHTNWLNMMLPRLMLARDLMAEDSAIFVTIDDHEVHNLRQTMDMVFGEDNFVATCAWQKTFAKKNKATISGSHDHVLVYARSIDAWARNLLPRDESQLQAFKNPDSDPRGRWQSVSFSVTSEDGERRAAYRYEIELPSGKKVRPPAGRHWNGLPDRYKELVDDKRIWFGPDGDNAPRVKLFLSEVQDGIVPDTWWTHDEAGNNQDAKKEILELFGDSEPFSTPKPLALVRRMLQIATTASAPDIVLDFFAGSGTTGHAVLAQNLADSGQRRFILVQWPERTHGGEASGYETISAITAERLRRAGRVLRAQSKEADLGFRKLKLSASNLVAWSAEAGGDLVERMEQASSRIRSDRDEEDLLFELMLKLGLDLVSRIETKKIAGKNVRMVGVGTLLACLAAKLKASDIEPLALGIVAWHRELAPAAESTVVFRDDAFPDDITKANLTAILAQHGLTNVRSL